MSGCRIYALLAVVLFAAGWQNGYAQEPGYWHLTDEQGLQTNTVYSIAEDRRGYLYLGTPAGVVRFDGFRFESLPNAGARGSDASDLQLDREGNILFSNFNHELFVYRQGKGIEKFASVNEQNFNQTGKYIQDTEGNIWFFRGADLNVLNRKTGKVRTVARSGSSLAGLYKGTQGTVAGTSASSVLLVSEANGKILGEYDGRPMVNTPPDLYFQPGTGSVLLAQSRFARFPIDGMSQIRLGDNPGIRSVNSCGMLNDSSIWVCTGNGVAMYDKEGRPRFGGRLLLEGRNASVVYRDRRGNVWIGTLNDGLYMVSGFQVENYVFHNRNHLRNGVYRLFVKGPTMYAGMQNGEVKMIGENRTETWDTRLGRSVYYISDLPGKKEWLINNYLIPEGAPAEKLTPGLGAPKGHAIAGDKMILSNNIGVFRVKTGDLLEGKPYSDFSFFRLQYNDSGRLISSETARAEKGMMIAGRSGRVFHASDGRIWISASTGIYWYRSDTLAQVIAQRWPGMVAVDFADDGNGTVMIAVLNEGIFRWRNGVLRPWLGKKQGLGSLGIRRILGMQETLWIGTVNGLYIANKSGVTPMRISDGLLSNDVQDLAVFNGRVWVATYSGLSSFPVQYIPQNPNPPVLSIDRVRINGVEVAFLPGLNSLSANENNIEIIFNAIDFSSREYLTYQYRLLGQSDQWNVLNGRNNSLRFQGLPAGDYRLELLAFNDKGVASGAPLVYSFRIQKPWWKQWWFLVLSALVFTGLVWLILKRISSERERKKQLENDLRLSQLSSLKAQMNPHFMFNALNSIQDFILLNDRVSANTYLGKFSDLMRMVLEMSNRTTISLADELKALGLYLELEAVRFEDTLETRISCSENLDPTEWELPSMIIQPFVENAIKHGLLHKRSDRKLNISFVRKDDSNVLEVTIEDNGVGRKEAERIVRGRARQHSSFATGATDRRLKLLNMDEKKLVHIQYTDLYDTSGNAAGTRVYLEIRMKPVVQHTGT